MTSRNCLPLSPPTHTHTYILIQLIYTHIHTTHTKAGQNKSEKSFVSLHTATKGYKPCTQVNEWPTDSFLDGTANSLYYWCCFDTCLHKPNITGRGMKTMTHRAGEAIRLNLVDKPNTPTCQHSECIHLQKDHGANQAQCIFKKHEFHLPA
jgi:hypothetical protein